MKRILVKDLIESLEKLDPNLPIVSSSDEEGNSFSFVCFNPTIGKIDDFGDFITEDCEGFKENKGTPCVCIN